MKGYKGCNYCYGSGTMVCKVRVNQSDDKPIFSTTGEYLNCPICLKKRLDKKIKKLKRRLKGMHS